MRKDMVPGLSVTWTKPLTVADRKHWGTNHSGRITVEAGLADIAPETQPAYFSVTGSITQTAFGRESDRGGGCIHDEILRYWPKLKPIVALHLSSLEGIPMHGEANGWYDLVGYYGGLGEQYHVGNSDRHFPITPPADKPWCNTEYRKPTPTECLSIFADHVRLPMAEARIIADRIIGHNPDLLKLWHQLPVAEAKAQRQTIRELWKAEYAAMLPRWAAEAEAAKALLREWAGTVLATA
jgi:hypothetical protein